MQDFLQGRAALLLPPGGEPVEWGVSQSQAEEVGQGGYRERRSDLLAEAVTRALQERGWSLQSAENYSGVGKSTWDRLKKGMSVETEALIQCAYAVAEKGKGPELAMRWLEYAGRDTVVELMRAVAKAAREQPGGAQQVIEVEPGNHVRLLAVGGRPGSEFEATPDNLALIADLLALVTRATERR